MLTLKSKPYFKSKTGDFTLLILLSLVMMTLLPGPVSCTSRWGKPTSPLTTVTASSPVLRKTCPPLTPTKGMELSCFRRYTKAQHEAYINASLSSVVSTELSSKEKTRFGSLRSSDNCTTLPVYSPGTVAHYKCAPYFTTKDNTNESGFLKCTRLGNWRHKNRFNNFSCHLRADGWINKLIDENRVVIFSKSYCVYCTRVKELFKALRVAYQAIEIDHFDTARQAMIKEALYKKTGMKSWPNIFINRQHLGGYDKTVYGYHDGSLHKMLNSHRSLQALRQ